MGRSSLIGGEERESLWERPIREPSGSSIAVETQTPSTRKTHERNRPSQK